MLGYAQQGHAYRLLEYDTGRVVISTNVKFDELRAMDDVPHQVRPFEHQSEVSFDDSELSDDEEIATKLQVAIPARNGTMFDTDSEDEELPLAQAEPEMQIRR